jgi:hypothetical protein
VEREAELVGALLGTELKGREAAQ